MTFEEFLLTDDGKSCMSDDRPKQPYLRNRLYYAFEAGVKSGEHDARLQKTIEWYEEQLKAERKKNKVLTDTIKHCSTEKQPQPIYE